MGVSTPDVLQPSTSSSSSSTSAPFQVGMLFKFLDQWRSITSNRFVLNMVQGHHLQLRSHPPLFRNFWHFNVKVPAAHHPVIQKEVDELLAKGAIEPSSGGAGFYSSVFVVPKHTGGLRPILNLKHFNRYMHIPSFKMPTLKTVWQLIQQGDYAFSIDLQDAYLHVPIVKHHCQFLRFVWHNVPYQWRVLPFGLATAPRVFTSLTKPILFLCHHKGLHIVIYLDDILVLVRSKRAGKRACLFLCSLLVRLGLHINFSKSDLCLSQSFTFLGLCWDTVHMSVSLPPDKLADIQQLALSLLHTPHVTVHKVMSFLGKANFCINGHSQLRRLCRVIQSDMLSVYHSPTHCFLVFIFLLRPYINWTGWLTCNKVLFHCNSHFRMWSLLLMLHPLIGPFIFRDLGYLYPLVVHGLVPCLGLILPCRNFRLLQSCSVGWPSASLVRWLPCIWITVLLRLTCVIKVVQCLLFFPGWPAAY